MHGLVTHRLVIARLKKRLGVWRVDGVGELRDRGRLGKHVTIHLAGINDEDIDRAYVKDALNGQTFAVSIHSAQLLRFKTGSIWKDGKLLRFSPEISEECEINAGSGKIVSLGEKVQIHGIEIPQSIPQSHFLFGSDSTVDNREKLSSSKYVLLEAKTKMGNKWLIIPCTEILRFYFGVSSRLLSSTLAGELDTYFDFDKSGIENGRLKLHALKPLSRFEASVLGRTVASSDAKLAMNNVFNHLRSLHLNNALKSPDHKEPLTIAANFPFKDRTSLSISGKRILLGKVNDKEIWGIFVMQIWHCTHSFGFNDHPIIEYPFNDSTYNGNKETPNITRQFDAFISEEVPPDVEQVPANSRAKRSTILTFSNQFSALNNVRFEHKYEMANIKSPINWLPRELEVGSITFEGGSSAEENKNNLGVSISSHQIQNTQREHSLFISAIKEIKLLRSSWVISTPNLNDDTVTIQGEFLTSFPITIPGLKSWHLINGRPRQVAIVEIQQLPNQFVYLFEMELKDNESGQCTILLQHNNFEQIVDQDVRIFLELSARNNRWISQELVTKRASDRSEVNSFLEKYQILRLRHPALGGAEKAVTEKNSNADTLEKQWADDLISHIEHNLS